MQAFFIILQKNFSADNYTTIRGFFSSIFLPPLDFSAAFPYNFKCL